MVTLTSAPTSSVRTNVTRGFDFVEEREALTRRTAVRNDDISFIPYIEGENVLIDGTIDSLRSEKGVEPFSTRILVEIKGETLLVDEAIALPSIEGRLDLKGSGYKHLSGVTLCDVINEVLGEKKDEMTAVIEDNILVALLSSAYEPLSCEYALKTAKSEAETLTGKGVTPVHTASSPSGARSKMQFDGRFEGSIPAIASTFTAGMYVSSSNVGLGATRVAPFIENTAGREILGESLEIVHRGAAAKAEAFEGKVSKVLAFLKDFEQKCEKLLEDDTPLTNPGSVIMRCTTELFKAGGLKKCGEYMRRDFVDNFCEPEVDSEGFPLFDREGHIVPATTPSGEYIWQPVTAYDVFSTLIGAQAYVTERESAKERAGLAAGKAIKLDFGKIDAMPVMAFSIVEPKKASAAEMYED